MKKTTFTFSFLLFFAAATFGFSKVAAAQPSQVIPLGRGQSLSVVMDFGRCHPSQLSAVLKVNNISPNDIYRLPIGLPIILPADCAKPATSDVAQRSMEVLDYAKLRKEASRTNFFESEVAQLTAENQQLKDLLNKANNEVVTLRKQLKDLGDNFSALKARSAAGFQNLSQPLYGTTISNVLLYIFVSVLLTSLAWGVALFFKPTLNAPVVISRKQNISYTDELGAEHICPKVEDEVFGCPVCGDHLKERDIEKHFRESRSPHHLACLFEEASTVTLEPEEQLV